MKKAKHCYHLDKGQDWVCCHCGDYFSSYRGYLDLTVGQMFRLAWKILTSKHGPLPEEQA